MLLDSGKAIDTNKFFVICSNCLGACKGSTGPTSRKRKWTNIWHQFPGLKYSGHGSLSEVAT